MIKKILNNKILKKKYSLFALCVILFFAMISGSIYAFSIYRDSQKNKVVEESSEAIQKKVNRGNMVRRKIDGVYVNRDEENLPVIATMINNHVNARPTAGLAQANLVYEAEVEGGITRFMALYANNEESKEIGSIRSARPYFVDWVDEFGALYAHCGGSPEALVQIVKDDVLDLNEFYKGNYYWRDKTRIAPHNVYTSSQRLKNYFEKTKIKDADYFSWNYKEDASVDMRPASSSIEIKYRLKKYVVRWEYDVENNGYQRYVAGKLVKEKNGEFIFAKNVIIQVVNAKVLDKKLRLRMDTIGEGDAQVCLDGECHKARWKKNSKTSRTRFYNEENIEYEFNTGTTWIQIVRPEIELNF